jgi:hypothetical protein
MMSPMKMVIHKGHHPFSNSTYRIAANISHHYMLIYSIIIYYHIYNIDYHYIILYIYIYLFNLLYISHTGWTKKNMCVGLKWSFYGRNISPTPTRIMKNAWNIMKQPITNSIFSLSPHTEVSNPWGYPPVIQVMDDHDLVLKLMVSYGDDWGSPMT